MIPHLHFSEVSSTQDKAFELFEGGTTTPFFVTTDLQSRGRGRMQRDWASESGRSLTMSLALKLESSRLLGLTLVAGLAARATIEMDSIRIKWPNDLMLDDKKIGGILVESRSHGKEAQVVVGVGINLFDLQTQSYQGIQKKVEAQALAEKIYETLKRFEEKSFLVFKAEYEQVMWRLGEEISLRMDGIEKRVRILGVSDDGLLKTYEEGTLRMTDQGEIVHD